MSMAPEIAPRSRRGLWGLFVPVLLVAALAAGWSGFWFYAAGRADGAIDDWLAKEAARGRAYACEKRALGGFPFRAELTCDGMSAVIATTDGALRASAPRFKAVAQVYDPNRMIAELDGPVSLTTPDGRSLSLSYQLAQASLGIDDRRFDRGSLVVDAPRLKEGSDEVGAAKAFQAHVRRVPGAEAGAYDVAFTLDEGEAPLLGSLPVGQGPVSLQLQAEARGVDDSMTPKSPADRLRAFAEAGGTVHVSLAKLVRGDVAAEARGDLGLDKQGRIEGSGDFVARGADDLVRALVPDDGKKGLAALLGMGVQMLGKPAQLDGADATSYRIRIEKGRVAVGPIKVYKLPPAF
jgi:hypothetical protein